jgi:hypothetical protein
MSGWIKFHRAMRDHWLWKESKQFSRLEAWLWMLLEANWEDRKWATASGIVPIKRGQFITSQCHLAETWGWSRGAVMRFLKVLETDQMIELLADTKKTTITILNYEKYQSVSFASDLLGDQQAISGGSSSDHNIRNKQIPTTGREHPSSDYQIPLTPEQRAKLEIDFSPECVAFYIDFIRSSLIGRGTTIGGDPYHYVRVWILRDKSEGNNFFKPTTPISFDALSPTSQPRRKKRETNLDRAMDLYRLKTEVA